MKRVIIAGGRDFWEDSHQEIMWKHLGPRFAKESIEVISGNALGADKMGEVWAVFHDKKLTVFPADWKAHGKAAGPIRNREMAKYAAEKPGGVLIAFWDGKSRGTKNMIDEGRKVGLDVHIIKY